MSGKQTTAAASVTKIDGAPGSGKTYQLLQHVDRLRRTEDLKPWQMDFLTFSTAARYDVEQRLKETFHGADPDKVEKAVSTVHGAALGQVIGEVYGHEEFNEQWDLIAEDEDAAKISRFFRQEFPYINYDVAAKDPLKALERGEDPKGDTGNDIIAAYNFLRSKMWDYDAHQHAPVDIDEPPQRVTEIMRRWDKWKTENKYLQHDDYVRDAVEERTTPEYSDFLFIDEFQDLSPLQYKLYKIWRDEGGLRRIYIAGDADQSIYGFRGADPKYFRETDTDKVEPQNQSRRCPSDVVETANKALAGGGDMTPAEEGGDVEHVTVSSSYDLAELVKQEVDAVGDDGKVYLLLRTNHFVAEVTDALRTEGVPYFGLSGHQRWRSPAAEIYHTVRWLRGGKRPGLKAVIDALSGDGGPMRETARRKIDAGDMDRDEFLDWFDVGSAEGFMSALDLKDWQFDMITSALRSDAEHAPKDVRIGTLHAAKGLEAESVILFPDYSQRMYERYQGDSQDEEERIFYVGASRASNRLRIAHDFFDGPEFPAFSL